MLDIRSALRDYAQPLIRGLEQRTGAQPGDDPVPRKTNALYMVVFLVQFDIRALLVYVWVTKGLQRVCMMRYFGSRCCSDQVSYQRSPPVANY